jgi:hypothetical protein
MIDRIGLGGDLLRGAREIALVLYNDDSPKAVRRFYHEASRWPVFQLDENGLFYALKSRLLALSKTSLRKPRRALLRLSWPLPLRRLLLLRRPPPFRGRSSPNPGVVLVKAGAKQSPYRERFATGRASR